MKRKNEDKTELERNSKSDKEQSKEMRKEERWEINTGKTQS